MTTAYQHLSSEERQHLHRDQLAGMSLRHSARALGRSPATLSRELRRNACGRHYDVLHATEQARRRRRRGPIKLTTDSALFDYVIEGLARGWSPLQIAGRLRCMEPAEAIGTVSPETIYRTIYAQPRGELRKQLIGYLRQAHKARLPRARGTDRRGSIVIGASLIAQRPEEVLGRAVPGHWEGDLIKGAMNRSAVATLVERKSRYVLLARMDGCGADAALKALTLHLGRIPAALRKTLTYDQGKEMACHEELSRRLKLNIYFCDPHSPWQRGSNENANGLIREYLPKGMDLSNISQMHLNAIARELNERPRKVLGFLTPAEVFQRDFIQLASGVAPQS